MFQRLPLISFLNRYIIVPTHCHLLEQTHSTNALFRSLSLHDLTPTTETLFTPNLRTKEALLYAIQEIQGYLRDFANSGLSLVRNQGLSVTDWQAALVEIGTTPSELFHFMSPPFQESMEIGLEEPVEADHALLRLEACQTFGRQAIQLVHRIRNHLLLHSSPVFEIPEGSAEWRLHARDCEHTIRPATTIPDALARTHLIIDNLEIQLSEVQVTAEELRDQLQHARKELGQVGSEKKALERELGIAKAHVSRLLQRIRNSPSTPTPSPISFPSSMLLPAPATSSPPMPSLLYFPIDDSDLEEVFVSPISSDSIVDSE